MKDSRKLNSLDEYIFSRLEMKKKSMLQKGHQICDLSIGDPDLATPDFIVKEMINALGNSENFKYPPYRGIDDFRLQVSNYYKNKYNVTLDPENEIVALIGSKEGIAHLIIALTDEEDTVIIPNPSYPVYKAACKISNCNCHEVSLLQDKGYLPDLQNIKEPVLKKSKLIIVNYPNNPTGATATSNFYNELVKFGVENDIVVANDGAYLDILSNTENSLSLLQQKDAKNIGIEFGSLSKAYNMTGWRLGYVAGNAEVINKLMKVKTNFDSGQFVAIQKAGAAAYKYGNQSVIDLNQIYNYRKEIIMNALKHKNIFYFDSKGTFYIWLKVPEKHSVDEFCELLLERTGVIVTPGYVFGSGGNNFCRMSLTAATERIIEVAEKIRNLDL